jgi:hypothetical protein
LRCRCCCRFRNKICGVGQEPLRQFFGSFHNLFFTELTCVCRLSPFTKKPRPQPSCMGVGFRGNRARRAGVLGKAVRGERWNSRTGKKDLVTHGLSSAASKPTHWSTSRPQTRPNSKRLAARRRWHEG